MKARGPGARDRSTRRRSSSSTNRPPGSIPITADVINDLIVPCARSWLTTVSITHDMASVRKIADRVAMIHQGQFIWTGSVEQIDNSGSEYVDQFIHGRAEGPIQMDISQAVSIGSQT